MINAPELRRVLAHIEANQDRWKQDEWRTAIADDDDRCRTAFCFAGWKCQLDGVKWLNGPSSFYSDEIQLPDGSTTNAETYAAEAFGIEHTRDEMDEIPLFALDNTLDDLRRIVGELCAQAESEAAK